MGGSWPSSIWRAGVDLDPRVRLVAECRFDLPGPDDWIRRRVPAAGESCRRAAAETKSMLRLAAAAAAPVRRVSLKLGLGRTRSPEGAQAG
jgi:hypothetical protein